MSNILVTGSSRGLGLELVKQLAARASTEGGLVIATARKCSSDLNELVAQSNETVVFVSLDVADEASITQSVEETKAALNQRSLDVLINCAGVHSETHGKLAHIDMGGKDADLTVPQGAEAVCNTVESATAKDNGSFKNIYVPGWERYDEQPQREAFAHNSGQRPRTAAVRSTPGANGSNYHALQAKNIIELELDDCQLISRERQSILRSALQVVSSVAESEPYQSGNAIEHPRPTDPTVTIPEEPPRELLFMLLQGPPDAVRIQWPDHIPRKTYERMATALLQSDSRNQLFHQYCVCVYVKAIFHLYQVSRATDNPLIKSQLLQSKSAYTAAATRSIEQFNILQRPDIVTVQALISSALLMQHIGRLNQCWILTSYAARQISSLNYHKTCRVPATSELEQEIHSAVYWCYYLDRTLSSLLDRGPSLPDLEVSPTDLIQLDPSSPYDTLLSVILDVAQIQGRLHAISSCQESLSNSHALETCQLLESKMQAILPSLQSNRDALPKMVQYDWIGVDFCYYAIFVEIHRIHLKSSFSPHIYRKCLVHARKSLEAFHFLQQHASEMPGFDDPYPSFLTCGFFVVFCHIVGTSDASDYHLLRQITESLAHFKQDPHLGRLLTLLQSLQRLCEPLFQSQSNSDSVTEDIPSNANPPVPFSAPEGPSTDSFTIQDSPTALFQDEMALVDGPLQNTELDPSTEWQMWQLFNSQVPAGWLNRGVDLFNL
ncbi:hypothetical protein P170DRAFT_450012 [Aspergillus steynii IBT 23096]|uniref:Xylanolytic transcriptional activator regulatory domain-containing protein n=1 Tax=Aspergillus steynii IBT 23096 TaxID=1392250 RepID=A0A2I2FWC5_9EURO|nr:uncharacterized protein P170DRAFT_450012 [Aspergillus steynii IBT 23096]PLB44949.1 hypothetical protein P170DRAFT_450012 [Aspergillus steynii IBT 23096]